jgi:hypothetical protein
MKRTALSILLATRLRRACTVRAGAAAAAGDRAGHADADTGARTGAEANADADADADGRIHQQLAVVPEVSQPMPAHMATSAAAASRTIAATGHRDGGADVMVSCSQAIRSPPVIALASARSTPTRTACCRERRRRERDCCSSSLP